MGFKVGDKVINVCSGYINNDERSVGNGVVTKVFSNGSCNVQFDGLEYPLYCNKSDVELSPEPAPPRKMHPDDFLQCIKDFAADNGFKLNMLTARTADGHHFSMAK
jgi:hypothetical protein